jgi:hypothetical protein
MAVETPLALPPMTSTSVFMVSAKTVLTLKRIKNNNNFFNRLIIRIVQIGKSAQIDCLK